MHLAFEKHKPDPARSAEVMRVHTLHMLLLPPLLDGAQSWCECFHCPGLLRGARNRGLMVPPVIQ